MYCSVHTLYLKERPGIAPQQRISLGLVLTEGGIHLKVA